MAREVVARTVRGWQTGGQSRLCDDVTTVVSELVANACRHGLRQADGEPPWRIVLGLVRTDSHLMCVVSDPGAEPLSLLPLTPDAEIGHGLHIVDRTAADWGWHPGAPTTGKIVWAAFPYRVPA
jgi:anti-sigma regulatory factor (Ser/Thr protein kinase)